MLSLHCNAYNGTASGTETFYRGPNHKAKAESLTAAVCKALGTKNRGAKTEGKSQHSRLAVLAFQPCFLLEIGFIDNHADRAAMIDPALRRQACNAITEILLQP
jgi:N-acetylmuramoyl-L-alanine amidase